MAIALAGAPLWAQAWPSLRADAPDRLQGKVVYVQDGDTVTLLVNGRDQVKVRLASIDAPESSHTSKERGRIGQPHSANSKRFLEGLVKGAEVEATCPDTDRYRRKVCTIFLRGKNINTAMVASGWAWANTGAGGRYLRDRRLVEHQAQAKAERLGLWADASPIAPWAWRKDCWEGDDCPRVDLHSTSAAH